MPRKTMSEVQAANTRDIGYLDGKLSALETSLVQNKLEFKEHREESKKELEEIKNKLDEVANTMSLWRFGMWLAKGILMTIAAIASFKGVGTIIDIWN